ncbi:MULTISPECIES: hypothetical protein [unclassified Pseudofrankia]|uniref:hypothetical protein n=1 Tax=unclassified Pseudofrankia TaxID=2994372 RepID=UPI000AD0EFE7|nr:MULTISPECIES: hypothetical protein [unclassified Pseudofrankia]MDT3442294.1 hypothetical protein [Pseudofrankia sp. BMG5.37]
MANDDALTIESDWLPSAELRRLVDASRAPFPELSVSAAGDSPHRGPDPALAVAIVSGVFSLLVPFVTKPADRIFAAEPDAKVSVRGADGQDEVVVHASLPAEVRDQLLQQAIDAEHRIRAHVLLCWLALLLIRIAERRSGETWRTIRRQTGRIMQITLTGPAGTVAQTTTLSPAQKAIYQGVSVPPPARVTAFDPS